MTIPEQLQAYKDKRKLTLDQLAVLLGYDRATICRWILEQQKIGKQAREIIKFKLNIH